MSDVDQALASATASAWGGESHGLTRLSDVAPERVTWLWPARLPAGKLVVVDGDPSVGKSTLMIDVAARVSTGARWPDGAPGAAPAGVLLLSAEDGLADTIAPRLVAASADPRRIHALTSVTVAGEEGQAPVQVPPSLPRDIGVIAAAVRRHGVRLVVIDVLMAYLAGKVDAHRDQDVRAVLHRLAAMAEDTGATVVLVRHLNKAGGASPLYRGGGSIGIVGAARAAFLVARDPDDEDRRIVATTKMNVAEEPPALAYRLLDAPEHGCARVVWDDAPTTHTAAQLLAVPASAEERTERDDAADWLAGYLKQQGASPRAKVLKDGRAEGHSERTLKRAAAGPRFVSERKGFPATATWSLAAGPAGPPAPGHAEAGPTGDRGPTGSDLHRWEPLSGPDPQSGQLGQSGQALGAAVRDLDATTIEDVPLPLAGLDDRDDEQPARAAAAGLELLEAEDPAWVEACSAARRAGVKAEHLEDVVERAAGQVGLDGAARHLATAGTAKTLQMQVRVAHNAERARAEGQLGTPIARAIA